MTPYSFAKLFKKLTFVAMMVELLLTDITPVYYEAILSNTVFTIVNSLLP